MTNAERAAEIVAKLEHGDETHRVWLRDNAIPLITAALDAKDARIAKLREALEFYSKTVSGKIIEYYVNTGPLYEKYEVPLSDNGERARQALAESEDK